MFSFQEELDRLSNSPLNLIQKDVKQYISREEYQACARLVFPLDRAIEIHNNQYQRVVKGLLTLKDQIVYDSDAMVQLNALLTPAITDIHNYISSQLSLLDMIKHHSEAHGLSDQFASQHGIFKNANVTKFFLIYNDNILNESNFSPLLQFNSGQGYQKLVYRAADWLRNGAWVHLEDFFTSNGELVVIDDLIEDYYKNACNLLSTYQNIALFKNRQIIENVFNTLVGFSRRYDAIGRNGFLPVSRTYLETKLQYISSHKY